MSDPTTEQTDPGQFRRGRRKKVEKRIKRKRREQNTSCFWHHLQKSAAPCHSDLAQLELKDWIGKICIKRIF
jgi:hypothetical protein